MATPSQEEFYSISDTEAQRTYVSVRRASQWVGFLLPYLQPGFALLDCGCGVGSITLDLAEHVAPGPVIGIDMDESQLEIARRNAAERGLTNVTFEQGDVYALRFADASFDAVLAHTLLYHLSDPLRALREMRRVVKLTGVVGVADDDSATITYSPEHPIMRKGIDLWLRVVRHNGGSPFYSRHLRRFLLEAGFARTEGFAVAADYYGTLEETRRFAAIVTRLFRSPELVTLVTNEGWATQAELDELLDWVQQWGERPDAFYAVMYCAALGWPE